MLSVLQRGIGSSAQMAVYYCIGKCGGATDEIAKCPECGAKIGGTNHWLLQGNQFAPEMDGASHPACQKLPTYPTLTQTNFNVFLVYVNRLSAF